MFENLSIEEATVACIIKAKKSFDDSITQYEIVDEYIMRRQREICPRKIRKIILDLIKEGFPIISSPGAGDSGHGGYCWYTHETERKECINRLRRKAAKIFIRARNINRNCITVRNRKENKEQLDFSI